MEKVSVTIITLNEQDRIGDCLESVGWADEIIVSDSGSTDGTVDICRRFGAKVYNDDWLGYGRQKNLCQDRAVNPWILNIDADERVGEGLKEEIFDVLKKGGGHAGYYIPRKNFFGGRWIKRCGWYPDYNLRLYRKELGRFSERPVHEAVNVKGSCGYLKNHLEHYTYRDVSDYIKRMDRYSTLAAREMFDRGKDAGPLDLFLRPQLTFLKMYILRLGFLEGMDGLLISSLYASYTFTKYAKLYEMRRGGGAGS